MSTASPLLGRYHQCQMHIASSCRGAAPSRGTPRAEHQS